MELFYPLLLIFLVPYSATISTTASAHNLEIVEVLTAGTRRATATTASARKLLQEKSNGGKNAVWMVSDVDWAGAFNQLDNTKAEMMKAASIVEATSSSTSNGFHVTAPSSAITAGPPIPLETLTSPPFVAVPANSPETDTALSSPPGSSRDVIISILNPDLGPSPGAVTSSETIPSSDTVLSPDTVPSSDTVLSPDTEPSPTVPSPETAEDSPPAVDDISSALAPAPGGAPNSPPPPPPAPVSTCPPSPADCDFYLEGFEGQVPEIDISSAGGDAAVSPPIKGAVKGSNFDVHVVNSDSADYICDDTGTSAGFSRTQFYAANDRVMARTFQPEPGKAAFNGKFVRIELSSVQLEVFGMLTNLNRGQTDSIFSEDRRCIIFKLKA